MVGVCGGLIQNVLVQRGGLDTDGHVGTAPHGAEAEEGVRTHEFHPAKMPSEPSGGAGADLLARPSGTSSLQAGENLFLLLKPRVPWQRPELTRAWA